MARRVSLGTLIQSLRRELKIAESPSLGRNTRETHAYYLRKTQQRLHAEFTWPFMRIYRDVVMQAGQRYYAFPADIDPQDVISAKVSYGSSWAPLEYGITPQDYNARNSDLDQRNDPIVKWNLFRDPTTNGDMFEAWPIPASNGGSTVRFHGIKLLGSLIADADVCDLDDLLIVLYAAAELVPDKEKKLKLEEAAAHKMSLKSRFSKDDSFIMGGGDTSGPTQREIIVTHVNATS